MVWQNVAEIDPLGRVTNYAYDDQGRLKSVALPVDRSGRAPRPTYTYQYDRYGNHTVIADPLDVLNGGTVSRQTHFTYDHFGRQRSRELPLGQREWKVYDERPLDGLTAPESSTALGQLAFETDFEGNVIAYEYDNTATGGGRLVSKTYYLNPQITITTTTTAADLRTALATETPQ